MDVQTIVCVFFNRLLYMPFISVNLATLTWKWGSFKQAPREMQFSAHDYIFQLQGLSLGLRMQHISSDNSHAEHGTDLFFLSVVAILEIVGS